MRTTEDRFTYLRGEKYHVGKNAFVDVPELAAWLDNESDGPSLLDCLFEYLVTSYDTADLLRRFAEAVDRDNKAELERIARSR